MVRAAVIGSVVSGIQTSISGQNSTADSWAAALHPYHARILVAYTGTRGLMSHFLAFAVAYCLASRLAYVVVG